MNKTDPRLELRVCQIPDQLAAEAAERILEAAAEAIRARGVFRIALAGGSTPEKTYTLLGQPERAARIDRAKTYLFFGDERFVPPDDPRSNFGMARRTLLSRLSLPAGHVLPIPTDGKNAAEGAAAYARTLASEFTLGPAGGLPRFDLILLGLGDDGHTASLFPGAAALNEDRAWVTWSPPGTLPPPVDRVTLTFPVLNAARQVLFLVAGAKKAVPVRDVVEGRCTREQRPAAGVRPSDGTVTWMLDEAAAGLLTRKM
jgi:6-phosphogluconolactonase